MEHFRQFQPVTGAFTAQPVEVAVLHMVAFAARRMHGRQGVPAKAGLNHGVFFGGLHIANLGG